MTIAYQRPLDIAEAETILADNPSARILAGGQSLVPLLRSGSLAVTTLVDVTGIDALQTIEIGPEAIVIGAAATHAAIASHAGLAEALPALVRLAAAVGDPQVRNLGTIGGAIAHGDPRSDYNALCFALDAVLVTGAGETPFADHVRARDAATLVPRRLLRAIHLVRPMRAGYAKLRDQASRWPLAGVFAALHADGPRVAVTGAAAAPFRATSLEAALGASFDAASVPPQPFADVPLLDDVAATRGYRAAMIPVLARRAVDNAIQDY